MPPRVHLGMYLVAAVHPFHFIGSLKESTPGAACVGIMSAWLQQRVTRAARGQRTLDGYVLLGVFPGP